MRLRLVVARVGEMDLARWWNSEGVLGRRGSTMYRLGLPKTHSFAQARVVFTIARERCREVYSRAGALTLWDLPGEVEEAFEDSWSGWLQAAAEWGDFFTQLAAVSKPDLLEALEQFGLLDEGSKSQVAGLKRTAEKRAVAIEADGGVSDSLVSLLAAGFSRGDVSELAVPFHLGAS